ncbi:hypothetical protein N7457_006417 [Penicillium paradoxum]|uniref:uncharacterized protein n=1 Tax=Penicillium paradoxum TaxID=176176 RepID=UPI00254783EC|nr:uncharacterized protein N7457_006417 [Penicillium paradoxum]KAJ5781257.1 hypothetical protein N7457_006417 [Penicillium paradoxum]
MACISFGHTNPGTQIGNSYGPIYPNVDSAPLSTVPFRRDSDFVDRGTLLDEIYEKGNTPSARIALVGLGCVGIREKSPDTWVFWIHAANAGRFEQGFREIADRVKIPNRKNQAANVFHPLTIAATSALNDWDSVRDSLSTESRDASTEDQVVK